MSGHDVPLPQASFTHRNESFVCDHCRRYIPALATGCRNHCPYCLHSKHVDIQPGDRANSCQGLMKAVGYEINGKKGIVLVFRCLKCGDKTRNKAAAEDPFVADDFDAILSLSHRW